MLSRGRKTFEKPGSGINTKLGYALLLPILGGVEYAVDFYDAAANFIDDEIRQAGDDDFARAFDTAGPT